MVHSIANQNSVSVGFFLEESQPALTKLKLSDSMACDRAPNPNLQGRFQHFSSIKHPLTAPRLQTARLKTVSIEAIKISPNVCDNLQEACVIALASTVSTSERKAHSFDRSRDEQTRTDSKHKINNNKKTHKKKSQLSTLETEKKSQNTTAKSHKKKNSHTVKTKSNNSKSQSKTKNKVKRTKKDAKPIKPKNPSKRPLPPKTREMIRNMSLNFKNNAEFARRLKATRTAIAGHGSLPIKFEKFVLPDNIYFRTHRIQGQRLDDRIGIHIEAGHIDYLNSSPKYKNEIFTRVYSPGELVPDYDIHPPTSGINVLKGSITVKEKTKLSEILADLSKRVKPGQVITVDLATCQSYRLPDRKHYLKQNIEKRIEAHSRQVRSMVDEYGKAPPRQMVTYLNRSVSNIEKDIKKRKNKYNPYVRFFINPKRKSRRQLSEIKKVLGSCR